MTRQFTATCLNSSCCATSAVAGTFAQICTRMDTIVMVVSIFALLTVTLRGVASLA